MAAKRHREFLFPPEKRNKPDGNAMFRSFLAKQIGYGPTRGRNFDARKRRIVRP